MNILIRLEIISGNPKSKVRPRKPFEREVRFVTQQIGGISDQAWKIDGVESKFIVAEEFAQARQQRRQGDK